MRDLKFCQTSNYIKIHDFPPTSVDWNRLDYFFSRYHKSLVFVTSVWNEIDPRNRIINNCDIVRNTPEKVCNSSQNLTHFKIFIF